MYDVITIGELLIDFTPLGKSNSGNTIFERNPGGAPANVAVGLSKLGKKTAMISKVGYDSFGLFLKDTMLKHGVDTNGIIRSDIYNTTIAFVHLNEQHDRSFSFYRTGCADVMLEKDEINFDIIKKTKVFHFGSLSFTQEPVRSAVFEALKFAKDNNIIISYDPNYRPFLWKEEKEAKKWMINGLEYADILKVSKDELVLITGENDMETGCNVLFDTGISMIFVTLGKEGVFYKSSAGTGYVHGYDVTVLDTTGAGDAFTAGVLYHLCEKKISVIKKMNSNEIEVILKFANACGAYTCTKFGAIPALPSKDEINLFMKN